MIYRVDYRGVRRSITSIELRDLVIAWISLAFLFSLRFLLSGTLIAFLDFFIVSLIAVGSGFILHELAHKFTAIRYGHWAEFRLSQQGLALAFLFAFISFGNFIFAAPGATVIIPSGLIFGYTLSRRENGIISLLGPVTNLILALIFFLAFQLAYLVPTSLFKFYLLLTYYGTFINVWLAAFNLIPFAILDGKKIFDWNPLIWALFAIPSWAVSALFIIGKI